MGQRYWVIGGEYRNCRFDEIVPGTEEISGPFPDPHRARAGGSSAVSSCCCAATCCSR